ncbi:MAG TPA: hypothetical protein VGL58_18640 [Caulobacteraceae bacterium]|jgi:uncharacterized protein YwgA
MKMQGEAVHEIVALAGGRLIGKTRLQKAGYLLELSGLGYGFDFAYHHYGPYSEELAWAAKDATIDGLVVEKEEPARWGGTYSVFRTDAETPSGDVDKMRADLLAKISRANAVALELAATAALLHEEGVADWWGETARRKPMKATPELLSEAKRFWGDLVKLQVPSKLPDLVS